jgi:hypothetical protein
VAHLSFQRGRLVARLLGLCGVLVALLITEGAQAAPWCDALAQTIAAPPPIVAQDKAEISAWNCNPEQQNLVQRGPPPPDHTPLVTPPAAERAVGNPLGWPPPQLGKMLPTPEAERVRRAGFSTTVYRPPRG